MYIFEYIHIYLIATSALFVQNDAEALVMARSVVLGKATAVDRFGWYCND